MLTSDKVKFEFEFIDPSICNAWVAVAIGGSALIGAGASIYSANKASQAQTNAAQTAANTQMNMYNTTRADLAPYRGIGEYATGQLQNRLGELTSPISIDPNALENSDYYKFALSQGLKQTQNSAAYRGLGKSGAALKGAAAFTKGLATDTYKTAFDMANINQTNAYNRLLSLIQTGANAGAQTGQAGTSAATGASNALIGAGNAQAAGYNAAGGAISNLANTVGGYAAYKGLYGGGPSVNAGYTPASAGVAGSPYYGPTQY